MKLTFCSPETKITFRLQEVEKHKDIHRFNVARLVTYRCWLANSFFSLEEEKVRRRHANINRRGRVGATENRKLILLV